MTDYQRRAWFQQWISTDEGRAFRQASRARKEIKSYPFALGSNGTFRVEDMETGAYELDVSVPTEDANGWRGQLHHEFTIPEIPGGHTDEPLDLGELVLKPGPKQ